MPSSEEDGRKKRQVQPVEEETPKKVRVDADATASAAQKRRSHQTSTHTSKNKKKAPPPSSATNVASKPKASPDSRKSPPSKPPPPSSSPSSSSKSSFSLAKIRSMWKGKNRRVWDLEGALLYLVQEQPQDEKEYLTHDECNWVTFRVGHAGDASTIASWYRLAKQQQLALEAQEEEKEEDEEEEEFEQEEDPEIEKTDSAPEPIPPPARVEEGNEGESNASTGGNMLEVWLADGFGDDRTLPFVYSLVANVHHIPSPSKPTKDDPPPEKKGEKEETSKGDTKRGNEDEHTPPGDLKRSAVTKEFGAVVLLTMGFDEALEKILRIEWLGLNPDLSTEVLAILRQRLWLRLSTLSVMTACQGGIEWQQRFSLDPLTRQQEQEQKQKQQEQKKSTNESDKKPAARVSPRAE